MSIYTVPANLPTSTKIRDLNTMIKELKGLIDQGRFNKNELDVIYNNGIGLGRKFLRNQPIGNTSTTYTGWSHLYAEGSYSIWKYTPDNYVYNAVNELYMNESVLENRGQAASESATAFDTVFTYDGDVASGILAYFDATVESATEEGTEFDVMNTTNDYLYLGHSATFTGAKFEWETRGSNYTLVVEYYNGSSWTTMTAADNDLEDGTNNFLGDGHITWSAPSDWALATVNSENKYWVRISTSSTPVITSKLYYCIPKNNVIGLLALSSDEMFKEDWAWCTYASSIYVTIRNSGLPAYEGDYHITSASSETNKENFFVTNKPFTADYQSTLYDAVESYNTTGGIQATDGIILADATSSDITLTLPSAYNTEGKIYIIKKIDSVNSATVETISGETIDGAGNQTLTKQYDGIIVVSDGSNWHIISDAYNIFSKSVMVEQPRNNEDMGLFYTDEEITVQKLVAVLRADSGSSLTWTVRYNASRAAAGIELVQTGTETSSTTTGDVVDSIDNPTVPVNNYIWLETTAKVGTVYELTLTIFYKIKT